MRPRWFVPILGAVALLATACGSSPTAAPAKPTDTVTVDFSSNIETLDPGQWVDVNSAWPMQEIYSRLVTYSPYSQTIVPDAATWTVNKTAVNGHAPGTIYTFTIRPGVVFSNGDPMTATDVIDSLNRVTSCNASGSGPAPYGFAYSAIEGYTQWGGSCNSKTNLPPSGVTGLSGLTAINSSTVQITLTAPQAFFLNTLALDSAVILDHKTIGAAPNYAYNEKSPVGSGPYELSAWNGNQDMVLVPNPKWWGAKDGLGTPKIKKIVLKEDISTQTELEQFQKGQVDYFQGPIDSASYLKIQQTPSLKADYRIEPENGIVYLAFNHTSMPFGGSSKDSNLLREAVNLAINKAQLSKDITNNRGKIASQLLPPGIPGYDPSIQPTTYDVSQAKALVKQWEQANGVKGPIAITLAFPSNTQDRINTADFIQTALDAVGFNVSLHGVSNEGQYWPFEDNPSNNWQLAWTDWFQDYPDAQDFLFNLLSKEADNATNVGNYTNAQFESLITTADNLPATAQATRVSDYQKAEQISMGDYAIVPLYYYWNDALIQPWLSPKPTGKNVFLYIHPTEEPLWQFISTSH